MKDNSILYFSSDAGPALSLAQLAGVNAQLIMRHDFPDGEFKLQLPPILTRNIVVFHSLDHPNDKLIELLFVARTARQMGVERLTLIAPYLAYMRQDIAFSSGEVVSQKIIGELLASLFDVVITVDPHLHRISRLEEAIPIPNAIAISAAPILGDFVVKQRVNPYLVGPDGESSQWILQAALPHQLDHAVAQKKRLGDLTVEISLPPINVLGRSVVLLDDIASSGRTLARAAELLYALGAETVDVAVTHALFAGDALEVIRRSGVINVWSADTVIHPTNALSVLPAIVKALNGLDK